MSVGISYSSTEIFRTTRLPKHDLQEQRLEQLLGEVLTRIFDSFEDVITYS